MSVSIREFFFETTLYFLYQLHFFLTLDVEMNCQNKKGKETSFDYVPDPAPELKKESIHYFSR